MKRNATVALSALSALLLASSLGLAGCNNSSTDTSSDSDATTTESADGYDLEYTDRDCDPSYDESAATKITLGDDSISVDGEGVSTDGSTATITAEGVYIVSGTLTDGQLVVDADDAKVQVVLDGANITCSSGPAIYVKQAKKTFVTLADGSENSLADGSSYELTDEDDDSGEPEAALFSKDDLTLQGGGSLTVTGNCKHAVVSKDDLVITGGTYKITAVTDGLRGKNCVKIKDGDFTIETGEDSVKSNEDSEEYKGFVLIDGGTFDVTAGDDAFHAETALFVNGGDVTVNTCYEGYEGQTIYIAGGNSNITATDDAVNAATGGTSGSDMQNPDDMGANHMQDQGMGPDGNGDMGNGGGQAPSEPGNGNGSGTGGTAPASDESASGTGLAQTAYAEGMGGGMDVDSSCELVISGGTLIVDAAGDGLDSNGSFTMTGGTVIVNGPTSGGDGALDYGSTASISGGTIIAVGSSQMAEGFTEGEQAFALVSAEGNAGDEVRILDADGNELATMTATKNFQSVVISTDGMTAGTYQLVIGSNSAEFEASTEATNAFSSNDIGGQMQPMGNGGGQQGGGQRP